MVDRGATTGWVRLRDARVHLARREIVRNGKKEKCTWRAFEALAALIEADGRVVDRSVLFERLWPGVHVVDSALNHRIQQIRRILGDDAIETVPRCGYRLLVPVEPDLEQSEVAPPSQPNERDGPLTGRALWITAMVTIAALLLLGTAAVYQNESRKAETRRMTREASRLTRAGRMQDIIQGLTQLQRVVDLEPSSGIAHALLAEAMARSGQAEPGQERIAAQRAVDLDPGCGECRAILAWISMTRQWDWKTAREQFDAALRLDPNSAYAHLWYSQLLAASGDFDKSLAEVDRAIALEPWNHAHANTKADILYLAHRYSEAAAESKRALSLRPLYPAANASLSRIYFLQRRYEEGIRAFVAADAVYAGFSPDKEEEYAIAALDAFRSGGIEAVARKILGELSGPQVSYRRYDRALWRLRMGDADGAVAELEQGLAFRPFYMMYLAVDPAFQELKGREDFSRIIARVGL